MHNKIDRIEKEYKRWESTILKDWVEVKKRSDKKVKQTISVIPVKRVYTPADISNIDYLKDIGFPGEYPYTRGIYPTMYRGRPWTIRMVSGYGTAEDANKRFKFLLKHGETGLNVALDSPTIYGYDSDDPRVKGEVGQGGVPISSLADMETAFKDIPIEKVSTSLITHYVGLPVFAMFVAMAEKRGIPLVKIKGTTQNDPLWLFHVGNPVLPLRPSIKLAVDLLEWSVKKMLKWFPINVCGYHLREAGSNATQEAAFTIADATVYIEEALSRGLPIDQIAPAISFFLDSHNNFFEEIAKFRAMRKVWSKMLKEKYKVNDMKSLCFKFATQTSGAALTAQEPENNIVRTTIHALAAILGGTQSLHTDSYDEALALPSEKAVRIAVRTQQIILHESGIPDVIDPLGGSYYLEYLTNRFEKEIWDYLNTIEENGGTLEATENGFFKREITESAYKTQIGIEKGEIPIVGLNIFPGKQVETKLLKVTLEATRKQIKKLQEIKKNRDQIQVKEALENMRRAAEKNENLTSYAIKAAKAYVTNGEMYSVLKEIYGAEYPPTYY